jgi:hypothetical protein
MKELTTTCTSCGGTGETGGTEIDPGTGEPIPSDDPCPKCNTSGVIPLGDLSDDFIDFLNDLKDRIIDVKEKCDEIMAKLNE